MEKSKKSLSSGFDSVTGRIRRFCADTVAELGRCSWPSRQQLLESTVLVVVAMLILACFVAGVDEIARLLIRWVTVRG
ncbi:MAG: preprotein translocase subunit SecE [Lentisphaeria bacterium]|nr:preprotein translocase subunit SecE [Lentisphaerota bacterium]MBR2625727.1 preprotein translocase subunit SecE [Lentisphaeria bacterium]